MPKPHAVTSLAQQTFLARSPADWEISEDVLDGLERHVVVIQSRDAKGAEAQNACECAIARSTRRELRKNGIVDVFVLRNVAYTLEQVRGKQYQMFKYLHDGRAVVRMLDRHGEATWNTHVTLRPPSPSRSVGAQVANSPARTGTAKRRQPEDPVVTKGRARRIREAHTRVRRMAELMESVDAAAWASLQRGDAEK